MIVARLVGSWRSRLAHFGFAASLATVGALALPAGASALSTDFHVYNLSGHPLQLESIYGDGAPVGQPVFIDPPSVGSVLHPGSAQDLNVVYYFLQGSGGVADYAISGTGGRFTASVALSALNNASSTCNVPLSAFACNAGGTTIAFLDPPGTVHDIPSGQAQAQATVLKQLCIKDSAAKCTFAPTREDKVDSPAHQVGHALVNNTDEDQHTSISVSDIVGTSDSVGVTASAETDIFDVVTVAISATYGHTWTTQHTFTQTVDVSCAAHHRCTISATQPMLRDTGDFTLSMGNTTWHLHGVSFDTPDPNGNGAYLVDSKPLTPAEQATLPHGFYAEKRAGGVFRLPAPASTRPPANARLRVSITGPAHAGQGQTIHDRIVLRLTRPARRLVYRVDDVTAPIAAAITIIGLHPCRQRRFV